MSANPFERNRRAESKWLRTTLPAVDRSKRKKPIRRQLVSPKTGDEEAKFVMKAVICLLVLAVTPLILLQMITFFAPEFFSIPIAPK